MKFLPSEKFEIETTLSPSEIVAALALKITPRRVLGDDNSKHRLHGEATKDKFRITRIPPGKGTRFQLIVTGRFLQSSNGTWVSGKIDLHPSVFAFMCFWFGSIAFILIAGLLSQGRLSLLGLLVAGWLIYIGRSNAFIRFGVEAKELKPVILQLFMEMEKPQASPSSGPVMSDPLPG